MDAAGHPPTVERPRLVTRLHALAAGSVATLQAPAGSGKSVLLAQLATQSANDALSVTWLHCRPVVAAAAECGHRGGRPPDHAALDSVRAVHDLLASVASRPWSQSRKPEQLLLDDVLPSQLPIVNGLLQGIAEHSQTPIRLCIASRHTLALGLTELRLANRLLALGVDDLAFDSAELNAVADGFGTPPLALAPWLKELAGWVQPSSRLCRHLSGLRGHGVASVDELVDLCEGLFGEQIMAQLGQQARDFLLRISVPATFDESLAHALSGVTAADAVLCDLACAGVPIRREAGNSTCWSMHPLFRRYLLRLAEQTGVDTHHLHRQVRARTGRDGNGGDALHHAVAAGQMDAAVDFVVTGGGWRLVMKGVSADLARVLDGVSAQHAGNAPVALLAKIFYLAKRGQAAVARSLLDDTMARYTTPSDAHETLAIDQQLVDMHVAVYEDRAMDESDETRLHAIIARLRADDALGRALALNHLCTVTLHLGKFTLSQRYGEAAMQLYQQAGAVFGALHLHAHLGQMRLARGDLDGAEHEYHVMATRALGLPDHAGELVAIAQALRAEVAYEMNDIGRCESLLERAMQSVEDSDAWLDVLAATYRVATRLAFLASGLPGALSVLAHAERTAAARGMPRLLRLIRVERIRALTLSDELDEAGQEIVRAELGGVVDDTGHEADWAMRQGSTAVTLARFLVRVRRPAEALRILAAAEANALDGGQLLAVAKLRVMRAAALWQQRERAAAVSALCDAVRLLGKQPFRRFILDEGPPALCIVQAALDYGRLVGGRAGPLHHKLAELSHLFAVDSLARTETPTAPASKPAFAADHRAAHRYYLQLLAMGLSNKEIARIRGVSTNTVKYHLKRIYRDLHVDNRSRAVFRASELGIIPRTALDRPIERYPSG